MNIQNFSLIFMGVMALCCGINISNKNFIGALLCVSAFMLNLVNYLS